MVETLVVIDTPFKMSKRQKAELYLFNLYLDTLPLNVNVDVVCSVHKYSKYDIGTVIDHTEEIDTDIYRDIVEVDYVYRKPVENLRYLYTILDAEAFPIFYTPDRELILDSFEGKYWYWDYLVKFVEHCNTLSKNIPYLSIDNIIKLLERGFIRLHKSILKSNYKDYEIDRYIKDTIGQIYYPNHAPSTLLDNIENPSLDYVKYVIENTPIY